MIFAGRYLNLDADGRASLDWPCNGQSLCSMVNERALFITFLHQIFRLPSVSECDSLQASWGMLLFGHDGAKHITLQKNQSIIDQLSIIRAPLGIPKVSRDRISGHSDAPPASSPTALIGSGAGPRERPKKAEMCDEVHTWLVGSRSIFLSENMSVFGEGGGQ